MTTNVIKMEVSKTVDSKRVPVGVVEVFCPDLKAFGLNVEPTGQDEKTGELTYGDTAIQWLYNAVVQATKANARNKLQSGSTELKPNNKLASTLEELTTPSETGAVVLAERRTLIQLFKGYLSNLERPENVKALLLAFMEKPDTLALQPADKRAKIKAYFEEFGASVEAQLSDWQGDYVLNVIEQCDAADVEF